MIILKVTKKAGFRPLSRKHIFGKNTKEGSELTPPPHPLTLLRVKLAKLSWIAELNRLINRTETEATHKWTTYYKN